MQMGIVIFPSGKNLAPEWKRAAEKLKGKVKVGTVDATVHTNLAGRYEVRQLLILCCHCLFD